MTGLPEAVEQAIHAADETNTRIAEAANGSDLTDLYTEWGEALTALRSAILAYGAARERQGIERAAGVLVDWSAHHRSELRRTENTQHQRDESVAVQTLEHMERLLRALPVDQGEADVAAGRVVELGEALQRIRDNPPSAGDRPGNPMPASAPVAPPPAEEPADFKTFKASFDREWEANVKLRQQVETLRSELAASQREVERLKRELASVPSGENRSEG